MTSGEGSRTAGKRCRLRTFGQQVQSRDRSLRRGGDGGCRPTRSLLPPARRAPSAEPRSRFGPEEAARPHLTPLRQNLPQHGLHQACRPGQALRFLGAEAGPGPPPPPRPPPAAGSPPGARSPAPVCGSGAAPARPTARSRSSSSGGGGGPGISPAARPRGPALRSPSLLSVGLSLGRSCLPPLPQRHPRRLLSGTRRFGHTSARLLVRAHRSDLGNTILPALPPARAAASQQQQRQPLCGAAGPGGRAPTAMMGCVM